MDEKLKGLDEKLDKVISEDDYFTEQDKRRIRNGIKNMKSGARAKRFNPLPAFLTAVSICAFLVILGGIAGKELGFFANEEPPEEIGPPLSLPKEEAVDMENFIWKRYTIETGQKEVHYQDIHGNTVIWSGSENVPDSGSFDFDLFEYNLKTQRFGETFQSEIAGELTDGQVNDDWITWVDSGTVDGEFEWRIYALNRSTNEKNLIRYSKQVAGYGNPHIVNPRLSLSTHNNLLTWVEPVAEEDKVAIQLYDLDTRELVTVDETTYFATFPQISDHYLVWSDFGGYEFAKYLLDRRQVDSRTANKFELMFPKVNDEYVVWQEKTETNETRLVVMLVEMPVEFAWKETEVFKGDINSFDIGEDFIIWESNQKIYVYSLVRKETKMIGEGEFPTIRGNMATWQMPKESGEDSVLQVVELKAPELTDVEYGAIINVDEFGERDLRIENEVETVLAREDLFEARLKDTLKGAYLNEEGIAVVDFQHFGELVGSLAWEDLGKLIPALNEAVFKNPKVNKIYYTFDGDYYLFVNWSELENVFLR
ncbi:hypothetical protein [Sporosarcina highlanderae]|uniref:Uncharacterized protein n=1 Tax=Sporosarcina highlanderae TaxID=3035916 RepID=A0ABT8JTK0_9BACL|nr:hypothetical protein [Sporosarcina highlanderae]MDN4608445.1 hypothetical protein [Sporosarcina highlanderae]